MFYTLPTPAIFAHRGSSAHAPENTLASFELAIRQAADGIELDAKLSADQQIVVIHDQTVDRTTDGTGRVRDLPLSALRKLDAGSHFDIAFKGESIPTLAEVFEAVGKSTFINIELTNYETPNDTLPQKVTQLVLEYGLSDRVLFSSFNPFVLRRIQRILPEIPIGFLVLPGKIRSRVLRWLGKILVQYQAIHPERHFVTESLIQREHEEGKKVNVFTVNQVTDMRYLFSLQVDGIFTYDPLLARQVIATSNISPPLSNQ